MTLCGFCHHRPATLFGVRVPRWRVFGPCGVSQAPQTDEHDLCCVCYGMTFPEREGEPDA